MRIYWRSIAAERLAKISRTTRNRLEKARDKASPSFQAELPTIPKISGSAN